MTIALLALLGLGSGVSAIADGFYDLTVWGPDHGGVLALALAGAAAVTWAKPRLVPALAVGGLVGAVALVLALGVAGRSPRTRRSSPPGAGRSTRRCSPPCCCSCARERDRWLPLAFATAGVILVAGYVLLRMLDGDVEALFFGGRLRDPLGYVNGQAGYFLLGFWPCVALAEQDAQQGRSPASAPAARWSSARCSS